MSGQPADAPVAAPGSREVVLSYSHEDRETVGQLVDLIEQAGWNVWWDRDIHPSAQYDRTIEQHIDDAACVISAWSAHATQSRWVRAETERAASLEKLIPVMLDDTRPPLNISTIQFVSLSDWDGDANDPEVAKLLASVRLIVGADPVRRQRIKRRRAWTRSIGILVPPTALIAMSYIPISGATIILDAQASEVGFWVAPDVATKGSASPAVKFLESSLVLDTLRVNGIRRFRVTWPGTARDSQYDASVLDLKAQPERDRPSPSITLSWPTLTPETAVRIGVAGSRRERSLTLRGPLPVLRVTLNGPVAVSDGVALSRTAVFSGTTLEASVDSSEVDVIYNPIPHSTGFAIGPLSISDLNLQALRHAASEDESGPFQESTIHSGTVRYPDFGTVVDSLYSSDDLGLDGARGTLQAHDGDSVIAVHFEGTVSMITGGRSKRTLLGLVLHRHLPVFVVVAAAYLAVCFGLGPVRRRRFQWGLG